MYEWVSVFEEFMAGAYREGERDRREQVFNTAKSIHQYEFHTINIACMLTSA